jgi:phosphatidylglycerol:prolipoprotein diacylglycerol transferase
MLIHPQINPVALQLGPLGIHWYGLTYLAAFGLFFFLATRRLRHQPFSSITGPGAWSRRDIEDMLFLGVMGVVVGGRLGYCLFYKPGYYLTHPLEIFFVWQGGMSFHGGMLGVLASQWWFARSRQRPWLQVMDFVAPCVPTGLAMGRVGNFINGELWGRFSDPALPWGMVFPGSGSMQPRHPSQVYQFLLEGLLLFVLLWLYARKPRKTGQVSGAFLLGYGVFRFIAEFFREPDEFLGILALGMSMGQWLCVPMIMAAPGLWVGRQSALSRPEGFCKPSLIERPRPQSGRLPVGTLVPAVPWPGYGFLPVVFRHKPLDPEGNVFHNYT